MAREGEKGNLEANLSRRIEEYDGAASEDDDDLMIISETPAKTKASGWPTIDDELPDIHGASCPSNKEDMEMGWKQPAVPSKKMRSEEIRREKELKRIQREAEKEKRTQEKARMKAQKDSEKLNKQAMKPGECMKYMVVALDRRLVEAVEGCQILSTLQAGGVRYRIVDAPVPAAITFHRLDPISTQERQAEEAVVVMGVQDFLGVVEAQVVGGDTEALGQRTQLWSETLTASNLTLVVYGTEEYFRNQKSKKQKELRGHVLGQVGPNKQRKADQSCSLNFSRVDIETVLVLAQVQRCLNNRLFNDPHSLATFIYQVTKAIAERPYKHEKREALFSWYAEGSSTNTVKVDKNGVGLLKLWHQQLRQFKNVGIEVAQAIAREYPSPQALVQGYNQCASAREAALLLADIPVRRGAGPLASTRCVGPELSKKIHLFFTSEDPDMSLGHKT